MREFECCAVRRRVQASSRDNSILIFDHGRIEQYSNVRSSSLQNFVTATYTILYNITNRNIILVIFKTDINSACRNKIVMSYSSSNTVENSIIRI